MPGAAWRSTGAVAPNVSPLAHVRSIPAERAVLPVERGGDLSAQAEHVLAQIAQWGEAARQLSMLPADARQGQRQELEARVMTAGQGLQRALQEPALRQAIQASGGGRQEAGRTDSGATSAASPSPGGKPIPLHTSIFYFEINKLRVGTEALN